MPATRSKRLSRGDRRRQLLDVARRFLESEGPDRLTLAALAERAGVSKPVAYDHFETRSGLLIALLEEANRHYETDAESRIAAAPATIASVATIVAETYVRCAIEAGPAISTLSAAIEADSGAQEFGRAFQARHAAQFHHAFAPLLRSEPPPLLFKGLVAAANAICDELTRGGVSKQSAIDALKHLLVASLQPFAKL